MNPIFTKLAYFLLAPILGKKALQPFFEKLYLFSLAGMNYGLAIPSKSGEKYVLEYINSKLKKKIIVFDVGANKGNYTQQVIDVLKNKAIIFDFEPLEKAVSILEERFDKYKQVKIYDIGFSDKKDKSIIHFDEESSELASLYDRREGAISLPAILKHKQAVNLSTIDLFCLKNNINKIDLLKIDTEGHELRVLKGAEKMISKNKIKYIQFEFGGVMIDSRTFFIDIFSLLSPRFKVFRILQDGLQEIKSCNEKHEIFIIGNFLAINKNL